MSYVIRPARRSEAKPLIGLYAESGCGKTLSALLLARGFVGPTGKIVMIETESGRGEAYEDLLPGGYDVCSMRDSFSPKEYGQALTACEAASPGALIIDSASHEWEGAGGVLAMAAENTSAGKKGVAAWTQPKMEHQRHFMLRLMATPIPLVIVCMRAKYPMVEVPVNGVKQWTRSTVLEPKQAEDILSEMFVHGWIDREHRFQPTKYTREDIKAAIRPNEPITIESGQRLAEWSRGMAAPTPAPAPPAIKGAPVLTTAQKLAAAEHALRLPEGYLERIATRKLGGPLKGAPDEEVENKLLPYLRLLSKKDPAALDELAKIIAATTPAPQEEATA